MRETDTQAQTDMLTNWSVGRVVSATKGAGLDAVIAATVPNVFYVTGFPGFEPQYAVVTRDGAVHLVVPSSDCDLAAMYRPRVDSLTVFGTLFVEPGDRPAEMSDDERFISNRVADLSCGGDWLQALDNVLRADGLDKARIQVDEGGFSPTQLESLRSSFPDATLEVGSEVLSRCRRAKAPVEVARLRKASSITESSIEHALAQMGDGSTDVDLHREFLAAQVRQGARPYFEVVAVGSRTSLCNAEPNGTPLGQNKVIRFDVGCKYMMYCSDIARNAVLGEVSSKVKSYYQAILAGEQAGLEAIRPGVSASDLFHLMVDTVRKKGIPHYQRHHCGHGIGLDGYEMPLIAPQDATVLEQGMVLCLETPYYELGVGGLQVEDMVLVTNDGFELLTELDRDILVRV